MLNFFRVLKVTFHLKSGAQIVIFVEKITIECPNNVLSTYTYTGGINHPLYIRLDDVSAIECKRVFVWRKWFK